MSQHILNVDHSKCNKCQTCVNECPVGAIGESGDRIVLSRPEDCMACALCETICPLGCIQMVPGS
ncbi:4Fe-4S binding protein [Geothermobacter ehrlichii]|uniref:4Fe-4S binding protein n=1 Tax=Geothermobacter ehrlichii TaxID=213224 RepID=UPI0011E7A4D5|nr:4Fe-4S binding protein [Geothermobacter ehrlichii]